MMPMPQVAQPMQAAGAQPSAPAPQAQPAQLDQSMLQKVVMGAQRLMYDPATRAYFINGLKQKGNPVDVMAAEVVGLIKLLDEKSKRKLPRQIIAPAAISILIEAVHFAAQAGFFVMQKADIAACARLILGALMKTYGAASAGGQAAPGSVPGGPAQSPAAAPPAGLIQSAQRSI